MRQLGRKALIVVIMGSGATAEQEDGTGRGEGEGHEADGGDRVVGEDAVRDAQGDRREESRDGDDAEGAVAGRGLRRRGPEVGGRIVGHDAEYHGDG